MRKIKIGYFADGPWSHQALDKILLDETLQVGFVCARNDSPDPNLKRRAEKNCLDFITHPNINSDEFISKLRNYDCDLFVSMSFNQIFCYEVLNLPSLRTINCHAGKLPFYRGRNILNWALINDETEFGITVHFVDEGIDTGDIIKQDCYPITDQDDYQSLLIRAYDGCASILYEAIKYLQENKVNPISQEAIHPYGFYCSARTEGDEVIIWKQNSRDIFNFVRALCKPGPEARTFLGENELKINKVVYLPDAPNYIGVAGAVVGREDGAFFVKTADSCIKVIQWDGGNPRVGDRLK
ncbi:formyltransferase family protein [Amylibacter sp.]|nr:formyltransferase family protein [Amylibacter sp.]